MRLTVETKALADALKSVGSCVKRGVDSILGHVLLEADPESGLTISGTDLVREIKAHVAATVREGGSRTAHTSNLASFVGYATGDIVQMKYEEGRLLVKSGRSWAAIPTIDPAAYYSSLNAQAQGETFKLPDAQFQKTLGEISFCTDETKSHLLCHGPWAYPVDASWVLVSTIGVATMEAKIAAPGNGSALRPIVIPKRSAQLMAALFPDAAELFVGKTLVTMFNDDISFTTALVDGTISDNYTKQIEPGPHAITVNRQRLLKGLSYIKGIYKNVGLSHTDGVLKLKAARTDGSRAEDELDCTGELPFEVTMDAAQIASIVGGLPGEDLTLRFVDQVKAVNLSSESHPDIRGAVFPLRPDLRTDGAAERI